ncbi:MAG: hypothetical protein ACXVCY_04935 [Pseudobdellovibrionaceae bacterium]
MNRRHKVIFLAVLICGAVIGGGLFWMSYSSSHKGNTKMTRYNYFDLEGILEKEFEQKNFEKIKSTLDSVGPHIKNSQSVIDKYIYEYYTFRLEIDAMGPQIQDLNQVIYRVSMVKKRLQEIIPAIYNEKADDLFKRHWADKIDELLKSVQKKQDQFSVYLNTVNSAPKNSN